MERKGGTENGWERLGKLSHARMLRILPPRRRQTVVEEHPGRYRPVGHAIVPPSIFMERIYSIRSNRFEHRAVQILLKSNFPLRVVVETNHHLEADNGVTNERELVGLVYPCDISFHPMARWAQRQAFSASLHCP